VVDPIVGTMRLTKVLMDGRSDLNIMYAEMHDAVGISWARIRPTGAPFHGIVPRKQAKPLWQINLPITFGNLAKYRMEALTFEVVGFYGTYHTILGRPCYVKFMAIANYTYLKLKMLGLCGVITINTSFQRAYESNVECCELTVATIASEELTVIKVGTAEEALTPSGQPGPFEPTEGTKEVLIDPSSSKGKVVRIDTSLSPK
jgi:hypothetical protein